ncbi:hypothetical protein HYE68_001018 [Fusarium pseudograminearum]|nr:hypothetical protein HYE68_001018 [Fusarium pseudograminearum]
MSSSPEAKGLDPKAREAEYQALWQTCDRATRKGDYICADEQTKRDILYAACHGRIAKRRAQGKTMCGTKIVSMVDLHIQREASRLLYRAPRTMHAPDPAPNLFPYPAESQNFNANHVAFNPAQNPFVSIPQHQHPPPQVPMAPQGFDMSMQSESHFIRHMQEQLNTQGEYIQRLINTLRDYHGRIVTLESSMKQVEERAAAFAQTAHPIHHAMQYPLEGLNAGFDFCQESPATPASQTQDGNGDGDDQKLAPLVQA